MCPPSDRRSLWTYYDRRAPDYEGGVGSAHQYFSQIGVAADVEAIGAELEEVLAQLVRLPASVFVDVGAGPGVFTSVLPGRGFAVDQSEAALRRLRHDVAGVPVLLADAAALPIAPRALTRVFAGHLYGHLEEDERVAFLAEARRVADELIVLDSGCPPGAKPEEWQIRTLPDGTRHTVYKRHFDIDVLLDEVGGEALFGGRYYVLVRSTTAG